MEKLTNNVRLKWEKAAKRQMILNNSNVRWWLIALFSNSDRQVNLKNDETLAACFLKPYTEGPLLQGDGIGGWKVGSWWDVPPGPSEQNKFACDYLLWVFEERMHVGTRCLSEQDERWSCRGNLVSWVLVLIVRNFKTPFSLDSISPCEGLAALEGET